MCLPIDESDNDRGIAVGEAEHIVALLRDLTRLGGGAGREALFGDDCVTRYWQKVSP
jgi:hypothetical protein